MGEMKAYWKSLKRHPGIPTACAVPFFGFAAGFSHGSWIRGLVGAGIMILFSWPLVLITAWNMKGTSPLCPGCGNEIDPDWCCCGDSKDSHGYSSGHPFVPMGCDCYRAKTK